MIQVEGNINSVEKQLLYDILVELKAIREDLKARDINIPFSEEKPLTIDYTSMKRPDLMKLVTELDNKPEGWTKLSNQKLIELLKR
jgi:hypothetical protein